MPVAWASSASARSSNDTATRAANPPASCSSGCAAAPRAVPRSSRPARRQIVLALVSALEPVVDRISELTIEIPPQVQAHPDGDTFRSLFIDPHSWLCAATMIAEIGDCRERYPDYRALAADAGQAPVAVESGKSRHAKFRWACDHRLRQAFDHLADASRRHNPWAADIYNRARARGAGHAHATRILGRAWSQIIWRLWHDHDTYNPQATPPSNASSPPEVDTGGLFGPAEVRIPPLRWQHVFLSD